jgi:hypothetical protein
MPLLNGFRSKKFIRGAFPSPTRELQLGLTVNLVSEFYCLKYMPNKVVFLRKYCIIAILASLAKRKKENLIKLANLQTRKNIKISGSCLKCPVLPVTFCMYRSAFPALPDLFLPVPAVMAVLAAMAVHVVLFRHSCPERPALAVLFCLLYTAFPVLPDYSANSFCLFRSAYSPSACPFCLYVLPVPLL